MGVGSMIRVASKVFQRSSLTFQDSGGQAAHCRQSREETRNLMETSRRLRVILASLVCAAALGCDQPLAPPPPPPPPPPNRATGLGTATVAGQVIDADTGQPVVGAAVTIESVSVFTTRGQVYSPDGPASRVHPDARPLAHYKCGERPVRCRRVMVESAAGEPVEVELVPPAPDNGSNTAIFRSPRSTSAA